MLKELQISPISYHFLRILFPYSLFFIIFLTSFYLPYSNTCSCILCKIAMLFLIQILNSRPNRGFKLIFALISFGRLMKGLSICVSNSNYSNRDMKNLYSLLQHFDVFKRETDWSPTFKGLDFVKLVINYQRLNKKCY